MVPLMLSNADVVLALQGSCIIDVDFSVDAAASSTSSILPDVRDQDLGSSERKPDVIGVAEAEFVV